MSRVALYLELAKSRIVSMVLVIILSLLLFIIGDPGLKPFMGL